MSDTLSINIKIDNRGYPLVINRKDEQRYRNAAKKLNEVILAFRNDYPDKDTQDILSMSAFQFVYSSLVLKESNDLSPLVSELKDLRDDIADFRESRKADRT